MIATFVGGVASPIAAVLWFLAWTVHPALPDVGLNSGSEVFAQINARDQLELLCGFPAGLPASLHPVAWANPASERAASRAGCATLQRRVKGVVTIAHPNSGGWSNLRHPDRPFSKGIHTPQIQPSRWPSWVNSWVTVCSISGSAAGMLGLLGFSASWPAKLGIEHHRGDTVGGPPSSCRCRASRSAN